MKTLEQHIREETAKHMAAALVLAGGVHRHAADLLGIPIATYYRKRNECRACEVGTSPLIPNLIKDIDFF